MKVYLLVIIALIMVTFVQAETAKEVVAKADELIKSKSSFTEMKMSVIKPDWSREMVMKVWALEPDYAMVLLTAPAKDKGTVTLKR